MIFDAVVSTQSLAVLAVAILHGGGAELFLNQTRLGRQMQATAQNPTLARILGIPIQRMVLYTFLHQRRAGRDRLDPDEPDLSRQVHQRRDAGLAAFIAAIVGGFNQVRGAIARRPAARRAR